MLSGQEQQGLIRVQHRFLLWLYHYSCGRFVPPSFDYSHLLRTFDVTSLESRRKQYDILFVEKMYKGRIDVPALLACFPLHVPSKATRKTERNGVMNVPYARVDTVKRSLFVRAPMHINEIMFECEEVDMFHNSQTEFRAKVLAYVKQLYE